MEQGGSAAGGGVSALGLSGASLYSHLALDSADLPAVAYLVEQSGILRKVYFKKWNGSAWAELGGSATNDGVGQAQNLERPAMCLDGSGNPVVAWTSNAPGIYLKRWNGTS
jgi:hypothetical protein